MHKLFKIIQNKIRFKEVLRILKRDRIDVNATQDMFLKIKLWIPVTCGELRCENSELPILRWGSFLLKLKIIKPSGPVNVNSAWKNWIAKYVCSKFCWSNKTHPFNSKNHTKNPNLNCKLKFMFFLKKISSLK